MEEKDSRHMNCCGNDSGCRYRSRSRSDEEKKALRSRLNRMIGQLGGISSMIDDDRYCGDVLIQLSAVMSALRSFGSVIMKEHLKTCVADEIKNGEMEVIDEVMELFGRLQ